LKPTALIAEDEPLLAAALQAELARAWPELVVAGVVGDGASAVAQALALQPQLLFFDIRMPGLSGLEAAAELADAWPADGPTFPLLVFVTAYDDYAVQAFEAQAVDYLLKPVQPDRLARTVDKLQRTLAERAAAQAARQAPTDDADAARLHPQATAVGLPVDEATLQRLRALLAGPGPAAAADPSGPLTLIPASLPGTGGATLHMVPIDEVLLFEAADKYLRVLTAGHEYLIRTPLRELLPRLDPNSFWQVHRGTVVRAAAIDTVTRDASGRLHLVLRGCAERPVVSRLFVHRFRAM
jgi:DNA-binding LytR/AlgR family response regulator